MMRRTRFALGGIAEKIGDVVKPGPLCPSRRFLLALLLTGRAKHGGSASHVPQSAWTGSLWAHLRMAVGGLRHDVPELRASIEALAGMLARHDVHTITAVACLTAKLSTIDPDLTWMDDNGVAYVHSDVAAWLGAAADTAGRGRGAVWSNLVREAGQGLPLVRWFKQASGEGALDPGEALTGLAHMVREADGPEAADWIDRLGQLLEAGSIERDVYRADSVADALGVLRGLIDIDRLIAQAQEPGR